MSDSDHLLELHDVAKHFGGLYALSGLTFHVDEGEIVSVIGPNGAGKSTMFNRHMYEPDDGRSGSVGTTSSAWPRTRSRSSVSRGRSRTSICSRT
jgi:branched-chain amino acid transport system ATP-binding protein